LARTGSDYDQRLMRKTLATAAALAALAVPASAQASTTEYVCVGSEQNVGACAEVQVGCIVGSLKGYQYLRPCITVETYWPHIPPPGE
jgi:hypothetical protein